MTKVIVIGGGVGGMAAAAILAAKGIRVTVCEASPFLGGLAAALTVGSTRFDGGPYILLDPSGLRWALDAMGMAETELNLRQVHDVYEVEADGHPAVRIRSSLDETVAGIEASFAGQGERYRAFVTHMSTVHAALAPLQTEARPTPWSLVRHRALRHALFLTRTLGKVLAKAGLSQPVTNAVAAWTHIAGQSITDAPSPLALVPALIHGPGCFVPRGGVASVAERVEHRARQLGVEFRCGSRVARVTTDTSGVTGVRLDSGETLDAKAVVSNAAGISTLCELAPASRPTTERLRRLPLQSPGLGAYLLAERRPDGPYLRFRLDPSTPQTPCRLLVRPGALPRSTDDPAADQAAHPIRLIAPLAQEVAERWSEAEQQACLDALLGEAWTRERLGPYEELARMVPQSWGRRHVLYRNSMNPAMTARFMRQGRLPNRVKDVPGLFLVGSSTHPGQWVSFCLTSGVLGARALLRSWGDA